MIIHIGINSWIVPVGIIHNRRLIPVVELYEEWSYEVDRYQLERESSDLIGSANPVSENTNPVSENTNPGSGNADLGSWSADPSP